MKAAAARLDRLPRMRWSPSVRGGVAGRYEHALPLDQLSLLHAALVAVLLVIQVGHEERGAPSRG